MNSKFVLSIEPEQLNGIALGYGVDDRWFDSWQELGIFFFTTSSRPALVSTQPIPIQWVSGALSLGVKRQSVNLTTYLHLVPRSKIREAIPPLPQYASIVWCSVIKEHRDNFNFTYVLFVCKNRFPTQQSSNESQACLCMICTISSNSECLHAEFIILYFCVYVCVCVCVYDGLSKRFRTGHVELQMVQLFATRCSCIAILWVSLVSFSAITLCVASRRVFIVVVISLSTQSGNFWIHPCILKSVGPRYPGFYFEWSYKFFYVDFNDLDDLFYRFGSNDHL
jgi:hypothetical protein